MCIGFTNDAPHTLVLVSVCTRSLWLDDVLIPQIRAHAGIGVDVGINQERSGCTAERAETSGRAAWCVWRSHTNTHTPGAGNKDPGYPCVCVCSGADVRVSSTPQSGWCQRAVMMTSEREAERRMKNIVS